jgi:FkbM family methyltransferase|tara:strand:- start:795 stop:1568 length:774 start_codon:yes stop_codon:yes gene_type:complete
MPKLKKLDQKQFVVCVNAKKKSIAEDYKWLKFRNVENENYIQNRVHRMLVKEKETIAWIDEFKKDSVFFDVGANIGLYCLYSAITHKNDVYAFEPHTPNYVNLLDNINENKLFNCKAFPLALGETTALTTLGIKELNEGVSDSHVGQHSEYYHGCIEMPLDQLIEKGTLPQPDHVKIDVDGHEGKVVNGAINTISKCKSVLVELDLKQHMEAYDKIISVGLEPKIKVKRNKHEGSEIFNVIFEKGWKGAIHEYVSKG